MFQTWLQNLHAVLVLRWLLLIPPGSVLVGSMQLPQHKFAPSNFFFQRPHGHGDRRRTVTNGNCKAFPLVSVHFRGVIPRVLLEARALKVQNSWVRLYIQHGVSARWNFEEIVRTPSTSQQTYWPSRVRNTEIGVIAFTLVPTIERRYSPFINNSESKLSGKRRKDYSPLPWANYFESAEDVAVGDKNVSFQKERFMRGCSSWHSLTLSVPSSKSTFSQPS